MAIPDPNNQLSRYHRDATRPLERWVLPLGQTESGRPVRPGAPKTWNVDRMGDEASLERQVTRLTLLRGMQTLLDTAEADLLQRRLDAAETAWQQDEDDIRPALDDWADESGDDTRRLRYRYHTPTPRSRRLSAQATVIRQLESLWVDTDIELQSQGWRPSTQDVNAHDREQGKVPSTVVPSNGSGQIRDAFPDLFGGGLMTPTSKGTDPWLDVLFESIQGRAKSKSRKRPR